MTQTIEFKMTADERELVSAWLAGKNSIEAYNASLGKLDGAQAKNAQSAAQQNRAMSDLQSLLKKSETAQESYNRRVKSFRELLDAGRVSQESYSRAVGQARQELDKSKGASSDFSSSILGGIGPLVSGYASVGAAVGLVTQGIRFAIDANRTFIAETQEAGKKFDKSSRSFAIQAGLNDEERAAAEKRFVDIGVETGFGREKVGSAADALASAGFATAEASGGSLRAVLKTLNAQGLREADAGGIAESLAKFLDASGLDKTQANVESVANQFQAFSDTNLRLRDLPALATIGGALAGKVDPKQQIAAAGVLSRTTDAAPAATALQAVVSNLGTAAGQKDRVESLAELGLKPEQVDFRGEGLTDVLKTLDAALGKKSLPDQDRILTKLVEAANISVFNQLRQNVGEIETRAQTSEVEGAKLFGPAERLGSCSNWSTTPTRPAATNPTPPRRRRRLPRGGRRRGRNPSSQHARGTLSSPCISTRKEPDESLGMFGLAPDPSRRPALSHAGSGN